MTIEQFNITKWAGGMSARYYRHDRVYPIASVDFAEQLIGLQGMVDNEPEGITWVRCENVTLIAGATLLPPSGGVPVVFPPVALDRPGYDRLWLWFSISRASWLTIPRVLLHQMPDEWQGKMASLLEEYERTFNEWPEGMGTRVQLTDSGHLTRAYNWLHDYRHPAQGKIDNLKAKF